MISNKTNNSLVSTDGKFEMVLPAMLAVFLAAVLFTLPQPAMRVDQPFKVELLLTLFLMVFFIASRRNALTPALRFYPDTALKTAIVSVTGAFVVWSAVSVIWGASFSSVAHHTLLWAMCLIFFLIFTSSVRTHIAGIRFIAATFVVVALILGVSCVFDYLTLVDFTSSEGDIRIRYGKYAELLVTISPVLWALAIYTRNRRRKLLILFTAVLSWVTVMLSLSKGAFISGIIGFAVFFLGSAIFSAKLFRKRVVAFAAVWLVVTIGTQVFFSQFSAVPSTTSYITGRADPTRSTTAMRIFTWSVARQMAADHWLIGVGADNFGRAFNPERVHYREKHPDVPAQELAEDYLVERGHNEPLQVLSELGIVGLFLFVLPFVIFAFSFLRNLAARHPVSPILWAAVAGMTAFLVSSQFSSFSFRAAQNGIAFFMVFAIAVNGLTKRKRQTQTTPTQTIFFRYAYMASWIATLLFAVFCLTKAFAEYEVYMAERSTNYGAAQNHFRAALAADPEYAGAYLSAATRTSAEGDPAAAAQLTRQAIDRGWGITFVYSQLAKQQSAAGNFNDAETTYREALSIYPRSVYIRTEFVVFLESLGKTEAAAEQAAIARSIDVRQANGWYLIIKSGSVAAFYEARSDQNIAPPVELLPTNAVRQYLDKIPGMEPADRDAKSDTAIN